MVSMISEDPEFAVVFVQEKRDLAKVMNKGNRDLYNQMLSIINDFLGTEE